MERLFLDYAECFNLLKKYKLPVVDLELAKSKEELLKKAEKLGYPVVLKIISRKVVHKTDAGGVKLNIQNETEAIKAFHEIQNVTKKLKIRFNGVYVQRFIPGELMYVGAKQDPQFGPVITFGLGGVYVEVLRDVSYRIAPLDEESALEMIKETKAYRVLSCCRNKVGIKLLQNILLKVSKLMVNNHQVQELDLNPVIVNKNYSLIADARILIEK